MFRFDELGLNGRIKRVIQERRGYRIPQLSMGTFALEAIERGPRLNLVIPGVSASRIFGGASTAIRFFELARRHFPRARIVVIDEQERQFEPKRWPNWSSEADHGANNTIAFLKNSRTPLAVEPNDYFVATHWTTAYFVKTIKQATDDKFATAERPFVYLIQDFEAGFYPWSSLYLMAESTYADGPSVIPVFNTELLRDFVFGAGYQFPTSYCFEPALHPTLALRRAAVNDHAKRRLLLVYGRPSTARNAFELIVEALNAWSHKYDRADQWQVISLGEKHGDIKLNRGAVLCSMGKTTIEKYADYLLDASVGLSIMVSPHPSYPPLEMAEFGVNVVIRTFRLERRTLSVSGSPHQNRCPMPWSMLVPTMTMGFAKFHKARSLGGKMNFLLLMNSSAGCFACALLCRHLSKRFNRYG
jgi:O-antigen biosynthesis protein